MIRLLCLKKEKKILSRTDLFLVFIIIATVGVKDAGKGCIV